MSTPSQHTPERFSPFYVLPGACIGIYVVHKAIGRGGAQMAYLADAPDGRKVVLKLSLFPKGERGTGQRLMHERFQRQVAFFLQLRTVPGVAKVYAHDMHPENSPDGYLYMVQEWVRDSVNIVEWYRGRQNTLEAIVAGFILLANACGEMGQRGICHRDLKPDNVLMDSTGIPKIIDFNSGLSIGAERLTFEWAGKVPGTYAYKSPELCKAILTEWATRTRAPFQFHPAGDLHALGVIFYQVLTGEHPFDERAEEMELYEQIAYQVPALPRMLNPEVPFGLEKVTMKLLQKDPERRYQSGDEVVQDLEALLTTGEDWTRLFQTPEATRNFTPRPQTSCTRTGAPPLTPRLITSAGSAALDLAPSAIVLAPPRALALVPRTAEVASEEPESRLALRRRRARLLVAVLALALAFMVPWLLLLGQHDGAGSLSERGTTLFGKAKAAIVAGASTALAACVGFTGKVRVDDRDWLNTKCPEDARKAAQELGVVSWGPLDLEAGPNVIRHDLGAEIRAGPVEASAFLTGRTKGFAVRLFGMIRTGTDGASLRFTLLKRVSDGREFPICAIAAVGDSPGIPKAELPPSLPASELHPGYMLVNPHPVVVELAL